MWDEECKQREFNLYVCKEGKNGTRQQSRAMEA